MKFRYAPAVYPGPRWRRPSLAEAALMLAAGALLTGTRAGGHGLQQVLRWTPFAPGSAAGRRSRLQVPG